MRRVSTFLALLLLLFLLQCKPKAENEISSSDREMLASLREVQEGTGLSDEEIVQAVGRYCQIHRVMEEAFSEGFVTVEDWKDMPAKLKDVEASQIESASMAAGVSLYALKSMQNGDTDTCRARLRKLVAGYYHDISERSEDRYVKFRLKIENQAKNDDALKALLNIGTEQDTPPER